MAKKSDTQRALDKIDEEINLLSEVRARLVRAQAEKPKRKKKAETIIREAVAAGGTR